MSRHHAILTCLLGAFLLFILNGCMMHHLEVQTQYISKESLASYHVLAPDPHLDHPTIGQRLLVQWKFKASDVCGLPLTLHLKIRFHNHEETVLAIPIENTGNVYIGGFYIYELFNEDYFEKRGILTYLAEIKSDETVITEWRHPLWVELIQFQK